MQFMRRRYGLDQAEDAFRIPALERLGTPRRLVSQPKGGDKLPPPWKASESEGSRFRSFLR